MSIQRPEKLFSSKWAEYGDRFNIEDTGADYQNGRADIETGFPPQTMKSVLQGGVPPWGQDHNGILYQITEAIQWMQAGGLPSFNQDFCNKKMVIQKEPSCREMIQTGLGFYGNVWRIITDLIPTRIKLT
ncbi:hypothetical protein [Commensalibacter melissae]|uniref:hypothetical protein n=1 Tax=Commensalibacter melissae TaxID=2070537 RepID=UPI0012D9100B|nr:hypothetical protein [Commensalibacter melissae]MUG08369.1 hypothetical protein [Commensalibacter melissae]